MEEETWMEGNQTMRPVRGNLATRQILKSARKLNGNKEA
jgi:hypothetical protein